MARSWGGRTVSTVAGRLCMGGHSGQTLARFITSIQLTMQSLAAGHPEDAFPKPRAGSHRDERAKEVPGVPCTTLSLPQGRGWPTRDQLPGLHPQQEGRGPPPHSPPLIQVGISDATDTVTSPILARKLARVFWGGGVLGCCPSVPTHARSLGGGEPVPRGESWRSSTATKISWEEQNWTGGRPQAAPNLLLGWVSGSMWSKEPPLLSPAPRDVLSPAGSTGRLGVSGQERPSKGQARAASRGRPYL